MNPSPHGDLGAIPAEHIQQALALLTVIARNAPAKPDPPKYLTVQEAAAYCRLAVQTIYNNRKHIERMPGVRKLLFTRDALDAWLATRRPSRHKKR
jgi:excisionase family DNA binding protein